MRNRLLILVMTLLASSASSEEVASIQEKITRLDNYSIELLGISLGAAQKLISLKNSHLFIPLAHFEESDERRYWEELYREGYIKMSVESGLPYDDSLQEKTVWIISTDAGIQLEERLNNARRHNRANTVDPLSMWRLCES